MPVPSANLTRSIQMALILLLLATPLMAADDVVAARQRASELLRQQDWPAAADAYREVVELAPEDAWSWFILGSILTGLDDDPGAVEAMETALERGLSVAGPAQYNLACLHARQGRTEKAFELLDPAARSGFFDSAKLDTDPDLASLRSDARFAALRREADLASRPCEVLDEYRAMDFLLGTWDVYLGEGGPKAASATVEKSMQGCAVQERWSSTLGGGFETVSHFDAVRGTWIQKMIGSAGGSAAYQGGWKDGAFRLEGQAVGRQPPVTGNRRTWTPLDDGRMRMIFENSNDGGKTWTVGFTGTYVRRDEPAADSGSTR